MKQHKISIIVATLTTILSLAGFLCSALLCFCGHDIVRDICAAVFSSSFFVIALSAIGYCVEKNRLKNIIISNNFISAFDSTLSVVDEHSRTNTKGINTIIVDVMHRVVSIKKLLEEYYKGLFIKDRKIKDFVNNKLFDYFNKVRDLEVYNACPTRKGEVVSIHFLALMEEHQPLADELINLIIKNIIQQNNKHDYEDANFISDYEKRAEEIKKRNNIK